MSEPIQDRREGALVPAQASALARPQDGIATATGFYVAVDLGKARDFSVMATVERIEVEPSTAHRALSLSAARPVVYCHLVHLHRFALQTPYTAVAAEVAKLMEALPPADEEPRLLVDATGVGKPVLDIMSDIGLRPIGVTLTGGIDPTIHSPRDWRVPKVSLCSALQVAMQQRRIRFAAQLRGLSTLVSELEAFSIRINSNTGNETMEAWAQNDAHDDVVIALALAVWGAEHRYQSPRVHFL